MMQQIFDIAIDWLIGVFIWMFWLYLFVALVALVNGRVDHVVFDLGTWFVVACIGHACVKWGQ